MDNHPKDGEVNHAGALPMDPWTAWYCMWWDFWLPLARRGQKKAAPPSPDNVIRVNFRRPSRNPGRAA